MLTNILSGPDGFDHYVVPFPSPSFSYKDTECKLDNLRIGWCSKGPFAPVHSDIVDAVEAAATNLNDIGCAVEHVELEDWTDLDIQNISATINAVEGGSYLDPIISGSEDSLAESMRRRLLADKPSHEEYVKAINDLERLRRSSAAYFRKYDLLVCPTGPVTAHPHDSFELDVEGYKVPGRNALRATIPSDLTGCPAISIPYGWSSEGLPIGIQLIANRYEEDLLLQVAHSLETIREPFRKFPQL
jgi:aspartyl-tRNA(Asn)/glutamyl-tRNA(Gln) amidotransferase subunit A